jgi:hypothetical protein
MTKQMRHLLATVALLGVLIAPAQAVSPMPDFLAGQWCLTSGTNVAGTYTRAKNFCKESRPVAFQITRYGFWIKLANNNIKIICSPETVSVFASGWHVVAACGADDNSTPVYRLGFTFSGLNSPIEIVRWTPTG